MNDPLRIVLIDDNPDDRTLAARVLEHEFTGISIEQVNSAERLDEVLNADTFDLVITDYQLRWSDGLAVLRRVKALYPECPVIMFTNTGSQEIAVEAMKSGLDDYVIKSAAHFARLPSSVKAALDHAAARQRAALLEIRLDTLLDSLNVGVFRADINGHIREENASFTRLRNLITLEKPHAHHLVDVGVWQQDTARHLEALRNQHGPLEREVELRGPDGFSMLVAVSETVRQVEGETVVDGLVEDITSRREAERTAAEALEARERFLTIAAHELRTPLTALIGGLQLSLRRLKTLEKLLNALEQGQRAPVAPAMDAISAALARTERQAERLDRFVSDIIDLSRADVTQLGIAPERRDLREVVQSAVEIQRFAYPARTITWKEPESSIVALVDGDRIEQAVSNYLTNALKFSREEQPVTVRLHAEDGEALIEVRDEGIGLAPEDQERIWEQFYRGGVSHQSGSTIGLGLGLYVVRLIVERHGGRVGVESAPGVGATFWFTIPLAETELR